MSHLDWTRSCLLPLATAIVAPAHATDYLTVEQAQRVLVPQADTFSPRFVSLSKEQRRTIKNLSGVRQRSDEQQAWRAEKDDQLLAWLLLDNVIGKHEFITYLTAISPDGTVLGVEILVYRETHGGEVRDPDWLEHFQGKTLQDPFKLDEDIPNISGATLSSRNITDGVKRLLVVLQVAFQDQP